jgi:hypothetical protein
MNLKTILFALFTFLIAAFSAQASLVKVRSSSCSHAGEERRGSGVLLEYGGASYVLTSEHVILNPDRAHSCNIVTVSGRPHGADLIIADWANGLALLKTEGFIPGGIEWNPRSPVSEGLTVGTPVLIQGFPYDFDKPSSDESGRISSLNSYPNLFLSGQGLIQVIHAFADSGMSGSPVYSGNKWIGILSHRVATYSKSRKATTHEMYRTPTNPESTSLLVIPAPTVQTFLTRVLRHHRDLPEAQRTHIEGSTEDLEVRIGNILFHFVPSLALNHSLALLPGGDPVGVGGMDDEINQKSGQITASLSKAPIAIDSESLIESREWFKRLRAKLTRHPQVTMDSVVESSEDEVTLRGIRSLQRFFSSLKSEGTEPLFDTESVLAEPLEQELKNARLGLTLLLNHLEPGESTQGFALKINRYLEILEAHPEVVTARKLSRLTSEENEELWSRLFGVDFNASVQLKGALLKLEEKMSRQ